MAPMTASTDDGLFVPPHVRRDLVERYAETHRHYHTRSHIISMFRLFEDWRKHAQRDDHIEWAIWFHDAVYDPQRADNEDASMCLAVDAMRGAGCSDEKTSAVASMILQTRCHEWVDGNPDTALFLDLDLAILGASEEVYRAYSELVRKEYAHVPDDVFRQKRGEILRTFLARPRLYFTDVGRDTFEATARENIARELEGP